MAAGKWNRVWIVPAVLLTVHAGLLAYSARVHSPTLIEPAHLAAGISHWQFGRFELYRVNPPLVRMLAALPALAAGARTDWSNFYEGPGARPVFTIGDDFVAANRGRTIWLMTLARWACIPLSLIGGVVCYLWADRLYGRRPALLALALWCFSPNILAHASLITADLGATALGIPDPGTLILSGDKAFVAAPGLFGDFDPHGVDKPLGAGKITTVKEDKAAGDYRFSSAFDRPLTDSREATRGSG